MAIHLPHPWDQRGWSHAPSITSVQMPFAEQAAAVDLLCDMVAGASARSASMASRLAVHQSCGCGQPPQVPVPARLTGLVSLAAFASYLEEHRGETLRILAASDRFDDLVRGMGDEVTFFEGLVRMFVEEKADPLIVMVDLFYRNRHLTDLAVSAWISLLAMVRSLLEGWSADPGVLGGAERLLSQVLTEVLRQTDRHNSAVQMSSVIKAETLQSFDRALGGVPDIPTLLKTLGATLPHAGVHTFSLVQRTSGGQKVLASWSEGEQDRGPQDPDALWSGDAFSGDSGQPRYRLVHGLNFGKESLGYMVFDLGPSEGEIYDAIATKVTTAMKNAFLNEALRARTYELEWSLEELRRTQANLVEAEKQAGLSHLLVGLAHEINTPLGTAITAASIIAGELGKHAPSQEPEGGSKVGEALVILESSLQRTSHLVQTFRRVSVEQYSREPRTIDLGDMLQNLCDDYLILHRDRQLSVSLEGSLHGPLKTWPDVWSQILEQLVSNALTHAYGPGEGRPISLEYGSQGTMGYLRFRDHGRGLNPKEKEHLLQPFFTTRRSQGALGLGLNIVFNLVTGKLGGTFQLVDDGQPGTAWLIEFPLIP